MNRGFLACVVCVRLSLGGWPCVLTRLSIIYSSDDDVHEREEHDKNSARSYEFLLLILQVWLTMALICSISCVLPNSYCGFRIVNTSVSNHTTHNSLFFTNLQPLVAIVHITLLDGSHKIVTYASHVLLCPQLILHSVLYVLDFKLSPISVSKLLMDLHLFALFIL